MDTEKVKELCQAHWEYVKGVLEHAGTGGDIETIAYHYLTAMEHGYKHGWADAIGSGQPVAWCCENPDVFKQWNEG